LIFDNNSRLAYLYGILIGDFMESLYNALLQIRLWILTFFKSRKLKNDAPQEKSGYILKFYDEFDAGVLDRTKWESFPNWGRIHEDTPNIYCDDANTVVNTNLELIADNADFIVSIGDEDYNIDYTIGLIENYQYALQLDNSFGYYEMRCKIPKGFGMWPAFWLWPIDCWPPEIDIFEFWTDDECNWFNTNYHWLDRDDNHKQKPYTHHILKTNLSDNFHLYGLEWTDKYLKFYFDGILIRKINVEEHSVMRLVINNGLDLEKIENDDLPSTLEVDWVRYWIKTK